MGRRGGGNNLHPSFYDPKASPDYAGKPVKPLFDLSHLFFLNLVPVQKKDKKDKCVLSKNFTKSLRYSLQFLRTQKNKGSLHSYKELLCLFCNAEILSLNRVTRQAL